MKMSREESRLRGLRSSSGCREFLLSSIGDGAVCSCEAQGCEKGDPLSRSARALVDFSEKLAW
eukprot:IDg1690t1